MEERTKWRVEVEAPEMVVFVVKRTQVLVDDVWQTVGNQRHPINPGQSYDNEEPLVRTICGALHTIAVVAAWREANVVEV